VTYDRYIMSIANILVDDYNLHPDDAVELIDMNKRKVIHWYGSATPKLVAYQLMLKLRSMMTVSANPLNSNVALTIGAVSALAVGVFLIAEAVKLMNQPAPTQDYSYNPPTTIFV
jgi:uncharacterized membrane protein YkvI